MADNAQREGTANEERYNAGDGSTQGVKNFLMLDKTASILWLIRLYIIFSTIFYVLPLLGLEFSLNCYKRVLLGSAAISALRLHQRLPRVQFNMEFARMLMAEDSLHYLMYSVLFLTASNATMILFPIFLFAIMHASSYTKKVLNASGSQSGLVQKMNGWIDKLQTPEIQQQIFLFIATTEIIIFIVSIIMLFGGQASLLVPFFYYRFLQLRYSSRRNPYSKMAFGQFNLGIQRLAYHPKCPSFGKSLLIGITSIANRLSPATVAAQ